MNIFQALQHKGIKYGSIVQSIAGHDTGKIYVVLNIELPFTWLSDGNIRHVGKLKKKRIKHVRLLGHLASEQLRQDLADRQDAGQKNAYIRKEIASFIDLNRLKEER